MILSNHWISPSTDNHTNRLRHGQLVVDECIVVGKCLVKEEPKGEADSTTNNDDT
jgi:hypothetical protein